MRGQVKQLAPPEALITRAHPLCITSAESKMVEVVLKVEMACSGCSGAVERVLKKMEGVESYDVSLADQKVVVKGNVTPEAVLATVQKTGKKAELVQ